VLRSRRITSDPPGPAAIVAHASMAPAPHVHSAADMALYVRGGSRLELWRLEEGASEAVQRRRAEAGVEYHVGRLPHQLHERLWVL
jgi:hypothetical protein